MAKTYMKLDDNLTPISVGTVVTTSKEEQTKIVSPTTSSQDVLPDTNKVLSKVTVNAIPTETKSQEPNLSSNNQLINATSGKFMTSFTIIKDTTNHIASNIRNGKTLYGVTGNLQPAKEEQTKTITEPNFSSGNIVVTPTTGKVMTQVTINKDSNLIADNIKKDVTIFGVKGTLETFPNEPNLLPENIKEGVTLFEGTPYEVTGDYDYVEDVLGNIAALLGVI